MPINLWAFERSTDGGAGAGEPARETGALRLLEIATLGEDGRLLLLDGCGAARLEVEALGWLLSEPRLEAYDADSVSRSKGIPSAAK